MGSSSIIALSAALLIYWSNLEKKKKQAKTIPLKKTPNNF